MVSSSPVSQLSPVEKLIWIAERRPVSGTLSRPQDLIADFNDCTDSTQSNGSSVCFTSPHARFNGLEETPSLIDDYFRSYCGSSIGVRVADSISVSKSVSVRSLPDTASSRPNTAISANTAAGTSTTDVPPANTTPSNAAAASISTAGINSPKKRLRISHDNSS